MGRTINTGMVNWTINGLSVNSSKPSNSRNYNNCASRDISYIVMHYTGNTKDTDQANASYFANGSRGASAHFFIDNDSIHQSVELRDVAWHSGCSIGYKTACRNGNSIGIEMCCDAGNYTVSEQTQINAAYLCAELCKLIGITSDVVDAYVLRHYDVVRSNKKCPAQFVNDSSQWIRFKGWVKNILNTGKHSSSATTKPTPTEVISTRTLLKGSRGEDVKDLQNNLNYLGYSCGVADGIFGNGTYNALVKFQRNYGLVADGIFGSGSRAKMKEVISKKNTTSSTTYSQKDFIKDIQSAIGVTVDGIVGSKTLSALPTVSKSKNNTHKVVKPLQKYLNALGYNCGSVDGVAGSKFDSAVKSWQKANGCTTDSEFTKGGMSWRRILGVI